MKTLDDLFALVQAWTEQKDADGCVGCKFSDRPEWKMPCIDCKRNHKDYWRPKNEARVNS